MEMTPLMDVMFLVLIAFIYSIFDMAVHRGLKVELPDAAGSAEKGERIVITVSADDSLEFNGIPVTLHEAVGRTRALLDAGVELPVLVSGDKRSSLGMGLSLLGDLRAAGVKKVDFQVAR